MKKLDFLIASLMCFSTLIGCGGENPGPEPTVEYALSIDCNNCKTTEGEHFEQSYKSGSEASVTISTSDNDLVLNKDSFTFVEGLKDFEWSTKDKKTGIFKITMDRNIAVKVEPNDLIYTLDISCNGCTIDGSTTFNKSYKLGATQQVTVIADKQKEIDESCFQVEPESADCSIQVRDKNMVYFTAYNLEFDVSVKIVAKDGPYLLKITCKDCETQTQGETFEQSYYPGSTAYVTILTTDENHLLNRDCFKIKQGVDFTWKPSSDYYGEFIIVMNQNIDVTVKAADIYYSLDITCNDCLTERGSSYHGVFKAGTLASVQISSDVYHILNKNCFTITPSTTEFIWDPISQTKGNFKVSMNGNISVNVKALVDENLHIVTDCTKCSIDTESSYLKGSNVKLNIVPEEGYNFPTTDELEITVSSTGVPFIDYEYNEHSGSLSFEINDNLTIKAKSELPPDKSEPLSLTVVSDSANLSLYCLHYEIGECEESERIDISPSNLQYKLNDGEWTDVEIAFDSEEMLEEFTIVNGLNKGDKVSLRGDNINGFNKYKYVPGEDVYQAELSNIFDGGKDSVFDVSGNIMSLIDSSEFSTLSTIPGDYCFEYLFDCEYLKNYGFGAIIRNANNLLLPATDITTGCYAKMFGDNASLLSAPKILPATELKPSCYKSMFTNTGIFVTPVLKGVELSDSCYANMFYDCSSITTIYDFKLDNLANKCCLSMFEGNTSLSEMTYIPTSNLKQDCYFAMFRNCSNLEIFENDHVDKKLILNTNNLTTEDISSLSEIFTGTRNWNKESASRQVVSNAQYYC